MLRLRLYRLGGLEEEGRKLKKRRGPSSVCAEWSVSNRTQGCSVLSPTKKEKHRTELLTQERRGKLCTRVLNLE